MTTPDHTPCAPNEQEAWRPIAGYEGYYEVSSLGRVRRLGGTYGTAADRYRRPRIGRAGYWIVELCVHDRRRTRFVHRLVAAAFLGPCPDGMQVNHKDGCRSNPRRENLEYVTPSGNAQHRNRNGAPWLRRESLQARRLTEVVARQQEEIEALKAAREE